MTHLDDPGARTPALFSMGFRPFFLLAGLWAAVGMAAWVALLGWGVALPTAFAPTVWHAHEMLFGFAGAVIAGFLLTALPNWTGRAPLSGWPLGLLALLWCAGRVAVAASMVIGAQAAALIDCAFLAVMLVLALREIAAGRNWRNLPIAVAVGLLLAANIMSHGDAFGFAALVDAGLRLAVAVIIMLISLIGGRVVPSFTGNWLKQAGETRLPPPFGGFDKMVLLVSLLALSAWVIAPGMTAVAVGLIVAGGLHVARLARWRGARTGAEPLVWVLHLGYGWVAVGLALAGLGIIVPALGPSPALHALTIGAIGTMTLAVMTRATLGHSGRALSADGVSVAAYLLISLAALARIGAGPLDTFAAELQSLAGIAWIAGFGLFVLRYGPMHVSKSV